jgi:glutamine---fructose-6-phosphate transaminase (isomerizing)
MCGILGILSSSPVAQRLMDGLKRLEYRGYDSSGIAVMDGSHIACLRAPGKIVNLEAMRAQDTRLEKGMLGIAHTRWATHGAPTQINAHPHQSETISLVHNGVIENHGALREELQAQGYVFQSDTDTEVAVHLIESTRAVSENLLQAVQKAAKRLEGAFSLAVISTQDPDTMVGVRRASPLAVGHARSEFFLGSDALSLAALTRQVTFLEDGDLVVLTPEGASFYDADLTPVTRAVIQTDLCPEVMSKGGYPHFMLKEIVEQSDVVRLILQHYTSDTSPLTFPFDWKDTPRLTIVACGTSFYAGMVAKYWLERYAGLCVELDIASEFRYRQPPLPESGVALFISQSGETADTLAALEYAKAKGQHCIALLNVESSSMARAAHQTLPLKAGAEIGVASTKAFMAMLSVLALVVLEVAVARGQMLPQEKEAHLQDLKRVSQTLEEIIAHREAFQTLAQSLTLSRDVLYLGRGASYALAMEGALKLKEISYIHAEGYAAGELKHGPIALLDEHVPVVVLAPSDELFDKTYSNMQEALARGARLILLSDEAGVKKARLGGRAPEAERLTTFTLPATTFLTAPLVYAVPLQLLAYEAGLCVGADVDQPRNLAKSVTVE